MNPPESIRRTFTRSSIQSFLRLALAGRLLDGRARLCELMKNHVFATECVYGDTAAVPVFGEGQDPNWVAVARR
jgi:hypothetical protein